jgi:branched-chain amino acid transport system permease protein
MRFVNLAHGDLAVLAAYLVVSWSGAFGGNYWLTMVLVVFTMVLVGYVSQRALFNRTLGADPLPGILATFGLGIVIQNALLEHYTATDKTIALGDILVKSIRITDRLAIGWFPLITFVVAVVVLMALQLFLSLTRMGRAFRATADDPATAQLMGINYSHVYGLAMAIAFGALALAGFFNGARTPFAPTTGGLLLLLAFEAVVIGGLGSLWGTLVGGVVLGVAQTVGTQIAFSAGISPGWGGILAGHLVFLAVLAIRPTGLFARPQAT